MQNRIVVSCRKSSTITPASVRIHGTSVLGVESSKYTLLSNNFMTCQAEIGSYVQGTQFEKDSFLNS